MWKGLLARLTDNGPEISEEVLRNRIETFLGSRERTSGFMEEVDEGANDAAIHAAMQRN
jgi:hypothetical protein